MRVHQWCMITFTPVEVLGDAQGQPIVIVDPDTQLACEDKATYGCFACNEPLETHFNTPCEA